MFAFNVWLNNRLIDTVFYSVNKSETIVDAVESVRNSLINHDGYDSGIKVTWPKGQRITKTVYVIQGNYGQGFEDENEEDNLTDGRRSLREYRENGPGVYKMVRRLVR